MQYMNVKEAWYIYDTVLISDYVNDIPPVPGWFATFAALGASDSIPFFTLRNKSVGLAYNNMASVDQIPFALVAEEISVAFIAPSIGAQLNYTGDSTYPYARNDIMSPFWSAELPSHTSMEFTTNQDKRLKCNCMMVPPGYGPLGHVIGQGDLSTPAGPGYQGGTDKSYPVYGQGRAHNKFRWRFGGAGIGIPKRATISIELRMSEWARTALQNMWGPGTTVFWPFADIDHPNEPPDEAGPYPVYKPVAYAIQVTLSGRRQVQQRGAYHA